MSLSLPTARQLALRHPRVYECQDCPRCEGDFEDIPHALYECRWVQKADIKIKNLARRTLHLNDDKLYWPYVLHQARIKHKGLMVGFLTGGIPSWIAARLETLYDKKWKSVGSKLSNEILKIRHASWKKRCKIWSTRNPSYIHLLEEMEDDEEAVAREKEDQQRADLEEVTPLYQPAAADFAEAVGNF